MVTGRKEDVNAAKKEILSAAEHFSSIRAQRKTNGLNSMAPGPNSNMPGEYIAHIDCLQEFDNSASKSPSLTSFIVSESTASFIARLRAVGECELLQPYLGTH